MAQIEGLERILAEHPFFRDMSEHTRELIVGCTANQVFHDGASILREGDPADQFFVVRHGTVALEVHLPGRPPLVIETLGDGDVLGWSWLVPPYRVRLDARAVGLVRLLRVDARCLRAKCEEDCPLAYELYRHFLPVVAERLTAARLQLLDMYGHPGEYAEAATLSQTPVAPAKPSPEGE